MKNHDSPVRVSRAFRTLKPILRKWITVQRRYRRRMDYDDRTWAYGERPCIGFLAAAAWQCGAVALEEWRTEKGSRRDSCYGRCDLYICHDEREYFIEAKYVRVRAVASPDKRIDAAFKAAREAARRLHCLKGQHRLAVVFVVPYFTRKERNKETAARLFEWRKKVAATRHEGAWLFEKETPKERKSNSKYDYHPGIVMLVKSIRRKRRASTKG